MSWDEALFKRCFETWQRLKNKDAQAHNKSAVLLSALHSQLTVVVSALAEKPIGIFPIRHGYGQTRSKSIVLPDVLNVFDRPELNESLYICRCAFSSLVIREHARGVGSLNNETWLIGVSDILNRDYPGLRRQLDFLDKEAITLIKAEDWLLLSRGNFPFAELGQADEATNLAITLASKRRETVEEQQNLRPSLAKVRKLDTNDTNPAVHVFEKVLTAEDYQGGKRQIDSDADSSDVSGALSELNMDQVVRAAGETGSSYSGGLFLDEADLPAAQEAAIERESKIFRYPEWSRRRHQFIANWCTLFERREKPEKNTPVCVNSLAFKKEIERLRRKLEIIVNKPVWKRNQQDGSDLDLEAIVRFKTDLKAGSGEGKNLFIERRKIEQDLAVLILADISLSTDAWIANRRVFDTIQQSLSILTEALREFSSKVALAAFFSNTRNHCTYLKIKDFDEGWEAVPNYVAGLRPQGYTRMGPAIRHATHRLTDVKARRKLLLIISDSKPSDYDSYEGVHGESDVAHALLEARSSGIVVRGLAVAGPSTGHVKRIFGAGGFERFTDARGLSERIVRAFTEALRVN